MSVNLRAYVGVTIGAAVFIGAGYMAWKNMKDEGAALKEQVERTQRAAFDFAALAQQYISERDAALKAKTQALEEANQQLQQQSRQISTLQEQVQAKDKSASDLLNFAEQLDASLQV